MLNEQPVVRYVPVSTREIYTTICRYPRKERAIAVYYNVMDKLQRKDFIVDTAKWTQSFVLKRLFGESSFVNIPIFEQKKKIEDGIRICNIICLNRVIAKREEQVEEEDGEEYDAH